MEMHGSALMFGVGELVVVAILLNKTREVDGRIMVHFFIFEGVIIMSMGQDDDDDDASSFFFYFGMAIRILYVWGTHNKKKNWGSVSLIISMMV